MGDRAPQLGRLTVGVRPRKECQRAIGGADEVQRIVSHAADGVDITNEVVMRQLHTLRLAGGARRIYEPSEILGSWDDDLSILAFGTFNGRCQGVRFAAGSVEAERFGQQRRIGEDLFPGPNEDVVRATK